MGVVNEYINRERRNKSDFMSLGASPVKKRVPSSDEESAQHSSNNGFSSCSRNLHRFFKQNNTLSKLKEKQCNNNFNIKKVNNEDFKNME